MPHISLRADAPAPMALLEVRPEIAAAMTNLMMAIRRMESPLSMGERELIGVAVSCSNGTEFCRHATGAIATELLGGDQARVRAVQTGGPAAEPDPKLRALLEIGVALAKSPQGVTPELVATARAAGANDLEIHDAVLVASTLCMFNRYFDGIACGGMPNAEAYSEMGRGIASQLAPAGATA